MPCNPHPGPPPLAMQPNPAQAVITRHTPVSAFASSAADRPTPQVNVTDQTISGLPCIPALVISPFEPCRPTQYL